MRRARQLRGQSQKSRRGSRRQESRDDSNERTASADRLHTRRVFARRHEEALPHIFHTTALDFDKIYVSAGMRGLQLEIAPRDLIDFTGATVTDLVQ